MKLVIHIIGLLVALVALSGCVPHLSKAQCLALDGYQEGRRDGIHDKYPRDLSKVKSDCARFKIIVNEQRYKKGWQVGSRTFCQSLSQAYQLGANGKNYKHICPAELKDNFFKAWKHGLRLYCVPKTGYNLGRSGRSFPDFCASDQVNDFRNAYDVGYRLYRTIKDLKSQINALRTKVRHANREISRDENDIKGYENQIDDLNRKALSKIRDTSGHSVPLPSGEKKIIRNQIEDINRKIHDTQQDIQNIRNEIANLEEQHTRLSYRLSVVQTR